jgi:hypothetical protein
MFDVSEHSPDEYRLRRAYIRATKTGEPIAEILSVFEGSGRNREQPAPEAPEPEPEPSERGGSVHPLRAGDTVADRGSDTVAADEAAGHDAGGGVSGDTNARARRPTSVLAEVVPLDRALRPRR